MATGADGGSRAGRARLLAAAEHFGQSVDEADQWLHAAARLVAQNWASMLREAAGPIQPDGAQLEGLIREAGEAFAYAELLAEMY